MRVEVYRNLHNGLMSVRECGGKVLTHEREVFILSPRFVVQPAGRAKVLKERRKNVHAFVRGEAVGFSIGTLAGFDDYEGWSQVRYNPYECPNFTDRETGSVVHYATRAVVTTRGVFYDCTSRETP